MLPDKIKITNDLITLITNKRNEKELTAYQLSEKIGKNKSWIPNIENKRTKNISKDDLVLIFTFLLDMSNNDTETYLEEYIRKLNEKNVFQPLFNTKLYEHELYKQLHHTPKYKINDLEEMHQLPQGILKRLLRNDVRISPEERYVILKKVFITLGYINPKCIDTFLSMLGIPVPDNTKIYSFKDINQCYNIDSDFPVNWNCHNWGEFLDYEEWSFKSSIEQMENQADETEYKLNQIEEENEKRKNYPIKQKIELETRLNKAFSVLKKIVDNIDVTNYEKTLSSERYLETIINLLTDSDGTKIFTLLFKYPLHKLDPKDLKDICEFIDSKLDYEYSIHIKDDTTKEVTCIDDLLEDYSHLDCRYKPEIWGELNEMISFSVEDNLY